MIQTGQLPATFEVDTTLEIGDRKWRVVEATPKRLSDCEQSGSLRLVLSPLQTVVELKDILYSLPTINNGLCPLQKVESLSGVMRMNDDNWRQVEFVSEEQLQCVESEFQSIRAIWETKRKGVGFTGIHMRKLIEAPIHIGALTFSALKRHASVSREFSGFGFDRLMAIAERGFAFETTDSLRFFGVLDRDGYVVVLCAWQTPADLQASARD